MATTARQDEPVTGDALATRYSDVRNHTATLCDPLSDADASVQSMPDASPAKWHLAHTTWFFETFVLRDHVPGYRLFDERYPFLFNSYYEGEGERHARDRRGLLTRPALDEIRAWRAHVDAALIACLAELDDGARALVELGCHHEEQHQELLLTDILHLFAQNPMAPAYGRDIGPHASQGPQEWVEGRTGIVAIGHSGDAFAFDCETPKHRALLTPHAVARRLVTNREWAAFIADGGYRDPRHWLSDGWARVQHEGVTEPLYWRGGDAFTLAGMNARDPDAPVAHISLYEADAYASWAGARLPTEFEWEAAAQDGRCDDLFGQVWQWTGSAYRPYPGFRAAEGAVGEYNGKFMSGQFVLRGSSCATPPGHSRATYRNFFYPHQRWQFTGVRLARDL